MKSKSKKEMEFFEWNFFVDCGSVELDWLWVMSAERHMLHSLHSINFH